MADERSIPVENYPSSSQDGQAIPLAAIRPVGSWSGQVPDDTPVFIELPDEHNLVSFYCTVKGTFWHGRESIAPIQNPPYQSGVFVFLPGVQYELVLYRHVHIRAPAGAEYIVNLLMKWGQLRNEGSYLVS